MICNPKNPPAPKKTNPLNLYSRNEFSPLIGGENVGTVFAEQICQREFAFFKTFRIKWQNSFSHLLVALK